MKKRQFMQGNSDKEALPAGIRYVASVSERHQTGDMATLHGFLAELGIEAPAMHPERQAAALAEWITDAPFVPVEGKSYELAFGKMRHAGEERHVIKRVRIDGAEPAQWFDLDEARPLDSDLQPFMVKAFRQLS